MAGFQFEPSELKPLIEATVTEVLKNLESYRLLANGRVALSEQEAADLIGLNQWQLRDIRRDGKIGHTRIVGNRVRYTLNDLLAYLQERHEPPSA